MTSQVSAKQQKPAEVIFTNGDFYGGKSVVPGALNNTPFGQQQLPASQGLRGRDFSLPEDRFQALAVSGGKIIATGSNDGIQKLKGPNTLVVDLGGRFAMPGFNDAHTHLASGGFEKL